MKLFDKEVLPLKAKAKIKERGERDGYKYYDFFLDIKEGKKKVATVYLEHRYFPVEYFYIKDINVLKRYRGRSTDNTAGVGGSIMRYIEKFLRTRARAGKCSLAVLTDAVAHLSEEDNSVEVFDMYKQHGWKPVVEDDVLMYRSPNKVSKEILESLGENIEF